MRPRASGLDTSCDSHFRHRASNEPRFLANEIVKTTGLPAASRLRSSSERFLMCSCSTRTHFMVERVGSVVSASSVTLPSWLAADPAISLATRKDPVSSRIISMERRAVD